MIELLKPHVPSNLDFSKILDTGVFFGGNYCEEFEQVLKKYFNVDNLLVTSDYSSAISMIVLALDLQPGDEVVMSPMACLVSTQPYVVHKLKIVWADINPLTGCLSPDSVKQKITNKTRLIVHNHFCGFVGQIDEINEIGKENKIMVLDDGIECFGSEYKNQKIGNCGTDLTCFSFSPARFPNTNSGGLVIVKNTELFNKCLLIRDCGIDRKRFRTQDGEINPNCDIYLPGLSAKMNNISALMGIREMEYVNHVIDTQRKNADKWKKVLPKTTQFPKNTYAKPNYWVFGVLVNDKEKFIKKMRIRGYHASGVHLRNDIYSIFGNEQKSSLPGVDSFSSRFVALPCGWWINESEIHL